MKKSTKIKTKRSKDSLVVKVTMSLAQHAWLQQHAGRGNVAEFIRTKVFGTDYSRNTLPAARYRWELAVALSWVGNNLQRLTEKVDALATTIGAKQQREADLIAFSCVVRLLNKCAEALVQISKSVSGNNEKNDLPSV